MAFDLEVESGSGSTASLVSGSAKFGSAGIQGGSLVARIPPAELSAFLAGLSGPSGESASEGWIRTNSASGIEVAFGSADVWVGVNNGVLTASGGNGAITAGNIADGTWRHVAVTFHGGNRALWVNGVSAGSVAAETQTAEWGLGAMPGQTGFRWTGDIDEVRVSTVARYTAPFTPPTTAFTSDANTRALWHLDGDLTNSAGVAAPVPPSIGTISVATASGTDTITYPAPAAGDNAVAGVKLYSDTSSGATTLTATNTGTGGGTFTHATPTTGSRYYRVQAYDTAANSSSYSNEVSTTASAPPPASIAPNDAAILFSPYTWDGTSSRAMTVDYGAYLTIELVGGTGYALTFDVSGQANPATVRIDVDGRGTTYATCASSVPITIPDATAQWTKHVIRVGLHAMSSVFDWNAAATYAVRFTGVTATTGTPTTLPVRPRPLRVLTLGDSMGQGSYTLADSGANTTTAITDPWLGWPLLLRDLLGAEVGNVSWGSTGWVTAAGSISVPAMPSNFTTLWGSGPARDLTTAPPDVIVINHGTNDGSDVTAAATTFLNTLLATAGFTGPIVLVRPYGGSHAAELQAAAAACTAPARVHYVDTAGWVDAGDLVGAGLHPLGYANLTQIGPRLAAAVRTALGTGGSSAPTGNGLYVRRADGTAKLLATVTAS